MQRQALVDFLENYFSIRTFKKDPQMSQFVPMVYQGSRLDYRDLFEIDFQTRFDGLMVKGDDNINNIYMAVFPTPDVIDTFLKNAQRGDMFFSHHPIYIENGDPHNGIGRGWLPLTIEQIDLFKSNGLSYFSCHSPMDYHMRVGTRAAMIDSLGAMYLSDFFNDGTGPHGLIGFIPPITTPELADNLLNIFNIPYLDIGGDQENKIISKVAIIAGGADNVEYMKKAEDQNVDAYICGEFNSRFNTPWGLENQQKVNDFLTDTNMVFFGVSHAACEYLTFRSQLKYLFELSFPEVRVHLIEQEKWWF